MITVDNLTKAETTRVVGVVVANASRSAWVVMVDGEVVLFAGVARETLLGEAELWIELGPFFKKHKMTVCRGFKPMLEWVRSQYPKLIARMEPGAERLAEFCGMRFLGVSEWPNGRRWRKYE